MSLRVPSSAAIIAAVTLLLAALPLTRSAAAETVTNPTVSTAGTLIVDRSNQTADVLPSGAVLIAGGNAVTGGSSLASCEVWNQTTHAVTATGALGQARAGHVTVTLTDSRIMAIGGTLATVSGGVLSNTFLASCEIYSEGTGTWSSTGALATPRSGHSATRLQDGRILVVGGQSTQYGNGLTSCELFNPATGIWTATGSLAIGRYEQSAALLQDGRVLVTGGATTHTDYPTSCEIYDPSSGTWSQTGAWSVAPYAPISVTLPDGKVLAFSYTETSGYVSQVFNPTTGTWTQVDQGHVLVTGNGYETASLLPTGQVYISSWYDTGSSALFDPDSEHLIGITPSPMDSLPASRWNPRVTVLHDGSVLRSGGQNANGVLARVVFPAAPLPVITSATTVSGQIGQPFTYQITATHAPTTFTCNALPLGLTFSSATGVISGTPTTGATSTVRISATNAGGVGTTDLTIIVATSGSGGGTSSGGGGGGGCGLGGGVALLLSASLMIGFRRRP
jgi:hypothetical protein